jgi:hypothetical protein
MKHLSHILKSVLLLVVSLPILCAFLLTLICSVTNFSLPCCVPAETSGYQDDQGSHHSHQPNAIGKNPSPDHQGLHKENPKDGHRDGDNNCCNDLTTSFFAVFQVQPNQFVAVQPAPVPPIPAIITPPEIHNYHVDQSQVYHGFEPPPRFYASGRLIRILHQSFLN